MQSAVGGLLFLMSTWYSCNIVIPGLLGLRGGRKCTNGDPKCCPHLCTFVLKVALFALQFLECISEVIIFDGQDEANPGYNDVGTITHKRITQDNYPSI
jgi:hypothetical protein